MKRSLALVLIAASCSTPVVSGSSGPSATEVPVTEVPVTEVPVTEVPVTDLTAPEVTVATVMEPVAYKGFVRNVVALSADGRAVVVRDGIVEPVMNGFVAADGETLISTSVADGVTTLTWLELGDGSQQAQVELAGELRALVTDVRGDVVGLTSDLTGTGAAPGSTEIVVATPKGEVFRKRYTTELLPEGFANAYGDEGLPISMFVVEYLEPAVDDPEVPRAYRVRVLDLITGELGLPFNLRDKSQFVDEEMLGFSRTRVTSRRDGLLFTLYRGIGTNDYNDAFVHTLGFANGVWCLDLPGELALDRVNGSVALAASESRLLVVSANGAITEFFVNDVVDPSRDPVPRRTVQSWPSTTTEGSPALATSPAGVASPQLLVGHDTTLRWLDQETLLPLAAVDLAATIHAAALLADGDAIVATDGRLTRVTSSGAVGEPAELPGGFGPVTELVIVD